MEDAREAKDYHDKAAAIRDYYARQGQSLDLANDAAEVMLWSRRRLGELFLGLPRKPGKRTDLTSDTPVSEVEEVRKELGVGEAIVRYWQQESRVDEADLVAWLTETREANEQITADGHTIDSDAARPHPRGDSRQGARRTELQAGGQRTPHSKARRGFWHRGREIRPAGDQSRQTRPEGF